MKNLYFILIRKYQLIVCVHEITKREYFNIDRRIIFGTTYLVHEI